VSALRRLAWLGPATLAAALAWAGAARWWRLGAALRRIGHLETGWALAVGAAACGALLLAAWSWCAREALSPSPGPRPPWKALLLATAVWALPARMLDAHLRGAWDYGRSSLADAAGLSSGADARFSVAVLASAGGGPGVSVREEAGDVGGLSAQPSALRAVRRYLESRAFRSVFRTQALELLRRGWLKQWEPAERLDALALGGPGFPPDFLAFLDAARLAPATPENLKRVDALAALASEAHFVRVDLTQKLFEGFSAAYAHFGEGQASNEWIDRIQRLWPLMSEDIRVEPIEQDLECAVAGRVDAPPEVASSLKVGLFAVTSTAAALSGVEGFVDALRPGPDGSFHFRALVPGRYYLALRGESGALAAARIEGAPGAFVLSPEEPVAELTPVRVGLASNFDTIGTTFRSPAPER